MVQSKVLITVTTMEYARRADFYDYLNMLNKPNDSVLLLCHDRSPAHGRNLLIRAAQENNCTHILFIDDDMAYTSDSLNKLLEDDKDVVSGLYLSRQYPHQPLVFDLADDDGSACPMYLLDKEPRLRPIVAAGFGFLLCKTSVFDKLEKPYVRLGELNSEQWCDDIGFFNRLRKAGIQSYVDMEVLCGHMGTMIIWPRWDEKEKQWISGYDTGAPVGMICTPQVMPKSKYEFVSQDK